MAMTDAIAPATFSDLRDFVERQSGQRVLRCNQCGKCSAGCPSAYAMDLGPRRVMRAIQLGLREEALSNSAIWLCLFCHTCSARCPMEIDTARVMESLRLLAQMEGKRPANKSVHVFHRSFLAIIGRWGRLYELGLGVLLAMRGGPALGTIALLPGMLSRGKLELMPPHTPATSEVRAIFARARAAQRGQGGA